MDLDAFSYLLGAYNKFFAQYRVNSAKTPFEVLRRRPFQTEKGLQWFEMSFCLPDNSNINPYGLIPNKEEWSYTRRTISSNPTKPSIIPLQRHASRKVDNNEAFTIGFLTKTTFHVCVAK